MSADGYLLLSIDAIRIEDRLRSVDPDRVGALAASISELGQLQPVGVAPDENGYILVDGEHRIAALRLLGRTEVAAIVREQSPEQRERAEIHSNLVRSDLTQLDRAIFIGRLADLYGLIVDPGARRGGDRRSANVREKDQFANIANWSSFARKTAERTGLGQRSIYAARELARAITPETAALLRGTPVVDNAAQLRQLMDLPEEDRLAVARQLAAGTARAVGGRAGPAGGGSADGRHRASRC
jgi:ParB family chromosome partitioning protein